MELKINRSAPNLVAICVDWQQSNNFGGRFYHKYQTDAILFSSVEEIQIALDRFYDAICFPQAATMGRRFIATSPTPDWKGREFVQETDKLLEHKGDLATFVVHVQYRQNATWQGKIIWADKKSECSFRSALEMIKLMDQALESTAPDAENENSERTLGGNGNEK
ncbi:MAG: hypothetical protein VB055_10380 [Oscillospiraceae bacterium]|nr:hypothetical protein [Oscillospiraceae bacterium]